MTASDGLTRVAQFEFDDPSAGPVVERPTFPNSYQKVLDSGTLPFQWGLGNETYNTRKSLVLLRTSNSRSLEISLLHTGSLLWSNHLGNFELSDKRYDLAE